MPLPTLKYAIYNSMGSFVDYVNVIHNDCPITAWAVKHDTNGEKLLKTGWTAKVENGSTNSNK